MKYNRLLPYLILFLGCLILLPGTAFGQKDSIMRDTIKEEYNKESDFYLKRREHYNYLTRAKIEELSMFKAGLSIILSPGGVLGPYIGYERKLNPDFSLNTSAAIGFPYSRYYNLSIGGRYYYNMRERIWEGGSANNLSANYFSAQIMGGNDFYGLEGLFGIQRRLGHLFFFDVNIGGVLFEKLEIQPVFNGVIGVGI